MFTIISPRKLIRMKKKISIVFVGIMVIGLFKKSFRIVSLFND